MHRKRNTETCKTFEIVQTITNFWFMMKTMCDDCEKALLTIGSCIYPIKIILTKHFFKNWHFLNFVVIRTFFSLWNLLIEMKSPRKWSTISRFHIGAHFLLKNLRKTHRSIEKWNVELIKNFVFFFNCFFLPICMTNNKLKRMDAKNPIRQPIRSLTFFMSLTFSFWWNVCKKINV